MNELLALKKGPDPALLELEDRARDALLEKVSSKIQVEDIFAYFLFHSRFISSRVSCARKMFCQRCRNFLNRN